MNWYKAKDQDTYLVYLNSEEAGLWIHYNSASDYIEQIIVTDKLHSEKRIKNSEDFEKASSEMINNLWQKIIQHPNWDKMIIQDLFELF